MTGLPDPIAHLASVDAGLGLRSNEVELVEHNPRWAVVFDAVSDHLHTALDGLGAAVEHIGSTSVPGLAAKPVLDIAIGAPPPVITADYVERLEAAGFDYQLDLGMYGGLLFTASTEPAFVVSHLHVVATTDFQWRWYLAFRDGLRSDPGLLADYQALKRRSARDNATNREGYTKAKFDWMLAAVSDLDEADS